MPSLAFVEGIINAAILLPDETRNMALTSVPLYQGVAPSLVADARKHHSRSTSCFKFVRQSLESIADPDLAQLISDWQLWLRLMDPRPAKARGARDEISASMETGSQAVKLILFAHAFNISFNREPLKRYLEQRKRLGGLDEHELQAECLLFEQFMSPRDFVKYVEQNSTRLTEVIPHPLLTTMHIESLVKDGQAQRARTLLKKQGRDLGETHSNRLSVLIDIHEGNDPRKQLEDLYQQTESLVDLVNLITYLKQVDDRQSLTSLTQKLFEVQRTVGNAHDVVNCYSDPPFFDHESIIDFLEVNADILELSEDLKCAKALALFQNWTTQGCKGYQRHSFEPKDKSERFVPRHPDLDFLRGLGTLCGYRSAGVAETKST